jgi:hypothetical protein
MHTTKAGMGEMNPFKKRVCDELETTSLAGVIFQWYLYFPMIIKLKLKEDAPAW